MIIDKDKIIFGIGTLVALVVISSAGYLYYRFQNIEQVNNSLEAVAIPVETSKPEVVGQLSFKDREIQVLNASGTSGRAKTYTDALVKLGYLKATAGNYGKTRTGNLLMAPENTVEFKADLKAINFDDYEFEVSSDIKIILGK